MSEPRDDLGTWLSEPVRPLLPPPGAFERITKRARRRKVMRALASSAAAAAVVAAAVTVPRLVIPQFRQASHVTSSMRGEPAPSPATHPAATTPAPTSTASPAGSTASQASQRASIPAGFQVSSVTFVGSPTGWVIGQAGTRGTCGGPAANCTFIARTDDAGQTWRGVGAPPAGAPNGPHGVSQIRFLNVDNGWAFGPELWATHDSGAHWHHIRTGGLRVIALEARGARAFAVWARCGGILAEVAGDCTSFSLYSTAAGSNSWVPVTRASAVSPAGSAGSALLVLTGYQGYLLMPNGELISGLISSTTGWGPVTSNGRPVTAPCAPGPPQVNGRPTGALFAATGKGLVLACLGAPTGDSQAKALYYSPNGGATWQTAGTAPAAGIALSLSGTLSGCAVLATDKGIEITKDEISNAASRPAWRAASGTVPSGGFTYVGMTTAKQGVAIPADQAQHAVWITHDSGLTWVRRPVRPSPA